jgi:hypothetical protein
LRSAERSKTQQDSPASAFAHAHFPMAAKILGRRVSSSFPGGKVKLNLSSDQPRNRNCHCCHCITDVVPTCSDDFGVERSFCWRQHVGFKASQSFRPLHLRWLPHLREAEPLKSEQKFKQIPIHHQFICLCSVDTYSLFVYIWKRHCKDN